MSFFGDFPAGSRERVLPALRHIAGDEVVDRAIETAAALARPLSYKALHGHNHGKHVTPRQLRERYASVEGDIEKAAIAASLDNLTWDELNALNLPVIWSEVLKDVLGLEDPRDRSYGKSRL